jgi:hypothetical protein
LDVLWVASEKKFFGALLVIDAKGNPLEFVHNTLVAPAGFLWPHERVQSESVAVLVHSLFDTVQREPHVLLCRDTLGSPDYCQSELAPLIPFGIVSQRDSQLAELAWANNAPTQDMPAFALTAELGRRGLLTEPFTRLLSGLREVYPGVSWPKEP